MQKEPEIYRYINDIFVIPDIKRIEQVIFFNRGISYGTLNGVGMVKANYGIRIRYYNKKERRKTVEGYGVGIFTGISKTNITVRLDASPQITLEGCVLKVRGKIALQ
ncbi:MAG: hypothetical protein IJC89_02345 [Clostridia bacterium]|nr:hypothetical protein [Clostridia bacterium]